MNARSSMMVLAAICGVICANTAVSQTTTAFTYQGQLRDATGRVNKPMDVVFSLWDAASGGAQVGSDQTLLGVSVNKGLFQVELDFGVGAFDGGERWLQIGVQDPLVGGGFDLLASRQKLTAAPYAAYAVTQTTLSSPDGTPSPAAEVSSGGILQLFGPGLDFRRPSRDTAFSVAHTGDGFEGLGFRNLSLTGYQLFLADSGDVGVGTAAPEARLHAIVPTSWNKPDYAFVLENIETQNSFGNTLLVRGGGGNGAGSSASNTFAVGDNDGNLDFAVRGDGRVIVSSQLDVVDLNVTGSCGACSDLRYKTDIEALTGGLERVKKLNPVEFDWLRSDFPDKKFPDRRQIGFIAQELSLSVPEAVRKDDQGYHLVDYARLTPVLTSAIKELDHTIEVQQEAIEIQQQRIESLEAEMAELRQMVSALAASDRNTVTAASAELPSEEE